LNITVYIHYVLHEMLVNCICILFALASCKHNKQAQRPKPMRPLDF